MRPAAPTLDAHDRLMWSALHQAADDPVIDSALRTLYADLDAAIAERGPTCWQSGKCCNFDAYGHRLYVTALEIAWFRRQLPPNPTPADSTPEATAPSVSLQQFAQQPGACPYQVGGACSTHAIRPLGCRVFFCQKGTEDWQNDLYEQFLQRLRALHDAAGLEYRYMDWIAGLELAEAATV
ncbi:MAG: hypothetical protein AAF750_05485 [Planctomycetota bacterium]